MFKFYRAREIWRRLTRCEAVEHHGIKSQTGPNLDFARAAQRDIPFVKHAFLSAAKSEAVVVFPQLAKYIRRCVEVSLRARRHDPHPHPFIEGQPLTIPVDDIFVLRIDGRSAGLLWLRDYQDLLSGHETFGEIYLLWMQFDYRGAGHWPQIDAFSKTWAVAAGKAILAGRCMKHSRRMAALFQRSGYECLGVKSSGLSAHVWRITGRDVE